mgnify:CR=1 FL=1
MHKFIGRFLLCLVILLGLSACGTRFFSSRIENPVLEDYIGTGPTREIGTLATRAGHRVNITRMADGKEISENKWQRGEFCMEPLPDAMENFAEVLKLKLAGSGEIAQPQSGTSAKGSGELDFYRSIATVMAPLLRRSQGLQWNRDNMTFVCNSYINRRINKEQYHALITRILDDSKELITKEMQYLPVLEFKYSGPPPGSSGSQTPSTTPEDEKKPDPKCLEEAKKKAENKKAEDAKEVAEAKKAADTKCAGEVACLTKAKTDAESQTEKNIKKINEELKAEEAKCAAPTNPKK